mmetsp:Transcript_31554/g.51049  ORF Transcript_31554/g.51049 Transcript_31554/m.51049 type:complete len:186 (+) Transcript_31554:671-1228(+)
MFVAPALSRAYPTHRHGQPEHSMLLMLQGRKHFVHWPNDAAEHLYEIKLGTQTETGDRVFMANPFTNDSSQQPDMVKAQGGYEGVVHEGELLYVPRGIHIIKNLDVIFINASNHHIRRIYTHSLYASMCVNVCGVQSYAITRTRVFASLSSPTLLLFLIVFCFTGCTSGGIRASTRREGQDVELR